MKSVGKDRGGSAWRSVGVRGYIRKLHASGGPWRSMVLEMLGVILEDRGRLWMGHDGGNAVDTLVKSLDDFRIQMLSVFVPAGCLWNGMEECGYG